MGAWISHRAIGRSVAAVLLTAGSTLPPASAEPVARAMAIGPSAPGCRVGDGGAEGLTCDGPDGWAVAIGYPAVGATLAFLRHGRAVAAAGAGWLPFEDVGDRRQPALWLAPNAGGRRTLILPVSILHPDDRRHFVERGEPPARVRRSRLFLVVITGDRDVCQVAVIERGSGPGALAEARRAAGAAESCPARPRLVGGASPTLARILAEAGE